LGVQNFIFEIFLGINKIFNSVVPDSFVSFTFNLPGFIMAASLVSTAGVALSEISSPLAIQSSTIALAASISSAVGTASSMFISGSSISAISASH